MVATQQTAQKSTQQAPPQQWSRTTTTTTTAVAAKLEKYLTFRVGTDVLAMPITSIREVLQFDEITTIPMTPDFVRGVLNLRGAVVPVIDLSVRFHRPRIEAARRTCVVIIEVPHEGGRIVVGVLVDQVNEVVGVDLASIEKAPTFGSSLRQEFMRGVANLNGQFVVVLDVERVLNVDELSALESMAG